MHPDDFRESWLYANPYIDYDYYKKSSYQKGQDFIDDLLKENAEHNRRWDQENANKTNIVVDLPDSYIDGGIVLKEGMTLRYSDFVTMDPAEWKAFEDWAESMPNIKAEEIAERKMLWVYDVPPVITSMAA